MTFVNSGASACVILCMWWSTSGNMSVYTVVKLMASLLCSATSAFSHLYFVCKYMYVVRFVFYPCKNVSCTGTRCVVTPFIVFMHFPLSNLERLNVLMQLNFNFVVDFGTTLFK